MSTAPVTPQPERLRPSDVALTHPEWLRDATIYQINTRQFTPEGTFVAAQAHLPRLAALGVRVLWLMPVHPIGELHRKGSLGSPYAVRDHAAVSPELGTREELRAFVDAAHALGLRVVLDWVANHTAWDCVLVEQHPEWYVRDWRGRLRPTPWWDWEDVVDLDYSVPALRAYMRDEMVRWVRELDVDGYRCDAAGMVPTDFWEEVRAALDEVKPVLLLAEWEDRELHRRAFDMTYAWSWNEALHHVANGRADVDALRVYYSWNEKAFPADAIRMTFVSNHDKNAWEGTEEEMFGDALEAAIWLSVVGEGMPLVYNGQEAGNDRRLEFFERDPIVWREHPRGELYRRLVALKREHRALWNGVWGARMVEVVTTDRPAVLAFVRDAGDDAVLAVFNLAPDAREVELLDGPVAGRWRDAVTGEARDVASADRLALPAWGFVVLTR